jgi:hypothetical protein
MKFCIKTTIPQSAVNVSFDKYGISSVYKSNKEFLSLKNIFWRKRKK